LTLSQLEARELAGKQWSLDGSTYTFANYDRLAPGQPPWKSGAEGINYPLLNGDGTPKAYVKFFDELKMTTSGCAARNGSSISGSMVGRRNCAARREKWVDTRSDGSPDGVNFDFSCSFAEAVPGQTWLELKLDVMDGIVQLDDDLRLRCVENLLRGLVFLERNGIVHGDLPPNNVIVDVNARPDQPALYLIDYDGFLAPHAGDLASLSADIGGTIGIQGYYPPQLEQIARQDPSRAAPFSDRYARDMLVLELLCFDSGCDFEAPPIQWDQTFLASRLGSSNLGRGLMHLQRADVFQQAEDRRPSSGDLAQLIGARTPPRIKRSGPSRHGSGGLGDTTIRELFGGVETWLWNGIVLLWLLCVVHVGLVAFWLTGWLLGTGEESVESATETGARLLVGAQLFLTAGAFLSGVAGLFMLAFAEREPRLINVMGFWFRIPACRNSDRDDLTHLGLVASELAAILAVLSAGAFLLVRL